MIYFTSDLHFGHENIIKLCNRPFSSVEEMNETLITNWNSRITNADDIYIIGDLFFRMKEHPEQILERLKGRKHLIIGNHDKSWMKKVDLNKYFMSVSNMEIINSFYGLVTLCHFPMMAFEGKYHIYGHIHNNKNDSYWHMLKTMDNALNASVEVNHYIPVTLDELIENNKVFRS